jgi:hypothetical protein
VIDSEPLHQRLDDLAKLNGTPQRGCEDAAIFIA